MRESRGRRSEGEKKRENRKGYDDNNLSGSEDEPDVQVNFFFPSLFYFYYYYYFFFFLVVLGGDVRVTDRRRLGRSAGNGTVGDREASTECTR